MRNLRNSTGFRAFDGGEKQSTDAGHLDVSVRDLVVVQVFEPLQDLPRVEADGGLVVLQGSPLGPEQCRQAAWGPEFSPLRDDTFSHTLVLGFTLYF